MSRPAAPASRRKHWVAAVNRSGRSASSRISSRCIEVSGHLGGRDGPQVVALDVVGLVGELRQVAGGRHGLGEHQGGRADLLVGVGVAVEGEGGEGPEQPGPGAPVEREHRARQLGAPLHVEDAELPRRSPSAGPAGARPVPAPAGPRPARPPAARLDVVLGAGAVGRLVGRAGWAGGGGGLRTSAAARLRPRRRRPAPRRPGGGSRRPAPAPWLVAGLPGLAHLARQLLDLGPQRLLARPGGPMGRRRGRPASTSAGSTPRRARAAFTASGSSRTRRMSIMRRQR